MTIDDHDLAWEKLDDKPSIPDADIAALSVLADAEGDCPLAEWKAAEAHLVARLERLAALERAGR